MSTGGQVRKQQLEILFHKVTRGLQSPEELRRWNMFLKVTYHPMMPHREGVSAFSFMCF